jgi:hypothetical protein
MEGGKPDNTTPTYSTFALRKRTSAEEMLRAVAMEAAKGRSYSHLLAPMLRRALREYMDHYHLELKHQGLENKLIATTPVQCSKRSGSIVDPASEACCGATNAPQHNFFLSSRFRILRIEKVETAIEPCFQHYFVEAMAIPHKSAPYPNLRKAVVLPPPRIVESSETRGRRPWRGDAGK